MTSLFVHDLALVESDEIGPGTRVWAFAHILPGAVVGENCNICDHAFIEGGVTLGDRVTVKNNVLLWDGVVIGNDVFLGPNVVFTNDLRPRSKNKTPPEEFIGTVVEEGASIGANSTIVCGVRIGANSFVGAGSVVTTDVPAHGVVFGNPGRIRGWICSCGGNVTESLLCDECGSRFVNDSSGGLRSA